MSGLNIDWHMAWTDNDAYSIHCAQVLYGLSKFAIRFRLYTLRPRAMAS